MLKRTFGLLALVGMLISAVAVRFLAIPPRVIWIRLGNCATTDIERVLRRHHADVAEFCRNPDAGILAVF